MKSVDKSGGQGPQMTIPVAVAGTMRAFTCFGCGGPHKKGDPSCKAGKYDVHSSSPADYKARMERKRKSDSSPGDGSRKGNLFPNKKRDNSSNDGKKHCRAFNFGKGTCRYGAKCKFLHEVKNESDSDFSPKQAKVVSAMVASAMKKTAAAIAKKNKNFKKASEKESKTKEKEAESSSDYAAIMASILLAPIRNTIPRELVPNSTCVMAAKLHSVEKNCGIDSDAGISISTKKSDFPFWLDETDEQRNQLHHQQE